MKPIQVTGCTRCHNAVTASLVDRAGKCPECVRGLLLTNAELRGGKKVAFRCIDCSVVHFPTERTEVCKPCTRTRRLRSLGVLIPPRNAYIRARSTYEI